jgi:hypothetical protein
MIENIQHEYFIWEEKNSTDRNRNLTKKEEIGNESSITKTNNDLTQKDWKDITDPKLRKKMRKQEYSKRYYLKNEDKVKLQSKAWYEANKEKIKEYYLDNKDTIKIRLKEYRKSNKDYFKKYNRDNKDKIKVQRKTYLEVNKEKISKQTKAYREVNKDKIKLKRNGYDKAYREVNKDKIKIRTNEYRNRKRKTDIQFKLQAILRSRLYSAVKDNRKKGSAVKDLGCTIEQLKQHLESKFQPGMSWDNHTLDGWHIDHIKPLSSFDLSDRKQLLEACHYTNLQPLWAKDNLTKSDKII